MPRQFTQDFLPAMKMTKLTSRMPASLAALLMVSASLGLMPRFAVGATQGAETPASQPAESQQPNDGSDYIAAWTVMGEICHDKYPQMKPAIDEFWTTRWNKETRERVANLRKAPEFQAKVDKHRKNLHARKDEILAKCGKLFLGGAH